MEHASVNTTYRLLLSVLVSTSTKNHVCNCIQPEKQWYQCIPSYHIGSNAKLKKQTTGTSLEGNFIHFIFHFAQMVILLIPQINTDLNKDSAFN